MNEKQQQLTFNKGITNVPSDALCSDNALEESVGLIYENGEHRPIQRPVTFIDTVASSIGAAPSSIPKIVYIHKHNNQTRYICATPSNSYGTTNYVLQWGTVSSTTLTIRGGLIYNSSPLYYSDNMQFSSIGKTLIISDSNGMYYYLWNGSNYFELGKKIPEPNVVFKVQASTSANIDGKYVHEKWKNSVNGDWDESIIHSGVLDDWEIVDQEAWNNIVIGYYRNLCNKASDKKCFTRPFLARYALELYDGEYTYISNPVVLLPSITKNGLVTGAIDGSWNSLEFSLGYAHMYFKSTTDYSNWTDLVKGVTVFVSPQIDVVDTESDQLWGPMNSTDVVWNGLWGIDSAYSEVKKSDNPVGEHGGYTVFKFVDSATVLNKLKESSTFFQLCKLGRTTYSSWTDMNNIIDPNVLKTLSTQQQLPYDDYYSRCTLNPNFIYTYNLRLNLADVTRSFFSGYSQFLPYKNPATNDARTYQIYVYISSEDGERIVRKDVTTTDKMGLYFYYPDSRATRAQIFVGSTKYCDLTLEEHPYLSGAYYFGALPTGSETESTTSTTPPTVNSTPEHLSNYVILSENSNPYVFKANGYYRVGMGKIIGMSTITQALSEGQFGQYPLLVFSTEGIWAMSVNSEGLYSAAHPMSREVCSNAKSITQIDGAVFFVSKKGLMEIVGNQVKCVSEQLSGKNYAYFNLVENDSPIIDIGSFNTFAQNAIIAYDYRDSMLWLFDTNITDTSSQYYNRFKTCWVYSIKGGTFGKYSFADKVANVINYYPDYLLQDGSCVYSLMNRQDIVSDNTDYSGRIVTRPMKLENALALKSIMQVRHIASFNTSATWSETNNNTTTTGNVFEFRLYASNNIVTAGNNWVKLSSLRGMPWKYYRFRYDFSHIKATDRFAGSVVITQERRTNKMR